MKKLLAAVMAVLLLTSCGAGDESKAKSSPAASSSTAAASSPTPSPTTSTATAQQYASIIAEKRDDYIGKVEELEACRLDYSEVTCTLGLMTLGLQSQTIELRLSGASDPSALNAIGEPPAELKPLVRDTLEAATAVQPAVDAFGDCEGDCLSEFNRGYDAAADLADKLRAWEPYI